MALTFGTFNLMQKREPGRSSRQIIEETVEQVRLADELGFEIAWFAEHHFNNYSISPSPLMVAAHCAGVTERIKLGTGVVVLPFYEPVRLAEDIAFVDQMSNGRLELGIGSGYQDYEFQRFRVQLQNAMDLTTEVLDIIELGLTQDSFSYTGSYFRLPQTQLSIRPVQQPMPRVWVAGMMRNQAIKYRVAQRGYVPFLAASLSPVEKLRPVRAAYDQAYQDAGIDPLTQPMGLMRYCHVTESKQDAMEAAERARYSTRASLALRMNYAEFDGLAIRDVPSPDEEPLEKMITNMVIGNAETCAQRILEDLDAVRPTHIALYIQPGDLEHRKVMRSLEKFHREVIPMLEREIGPLEQFDHASRAGAAANPAGE